MVSRHACSRAGQRNSSDKGHRARVAKQASCPTDPSTPGAGRPSEVLQELLSGVKALPHNSRCSASLSRTPPWRFVLAQGKYSVERVADEASGGFGSGNLVVKETKVLVLALANHEQNVMPDGAFFCPTDPGLASENLLLAATDLGLVTHPMTALDQAHLKKVLGVPEEQRFIITIPLA